MIWIYLAMLIVATVVVIFFIAFFFFAFISVILADAPFVEVPQDAVKSIVKQLDLHESSVLYDLGCGDSRVLIESVRQFPHITATGIDIGFIPYFVSKFNTRKYKNITIKRENFYMSDISQATHVFMYLYPHLVNDMIEKIQKECKPGTRIVSCDFETTKLSPVETVDISKENPKGMRGKRLFIYTI